MRCVRVALSAFGGAVLFASSTMAADIAAVPPPIWGFYVGGGVCYDWADFDITFNESYTGQPPFTNVNTDPGNISNYNLNNLPYPTPYPKLRAEGPCATVIIGNDWQIDNNVVVGIFADFDFQKKEDEFRYPVNYVTSQPDFQGQIWNVGLGNVATVGARAGFLVDPKVLLYGLIGWSWSKASLGYFEGCLPDPPGCNNLAYSQTHNVDGLTFGAGIEALFGNNWSGRAEYRFTDYGSITSMGEGPDPNFSGITTASVTDQSVRLLLIYRP